MSYDLKDYEKFWRNERGDYALLGPDEPLGDSPSDEELQRHLDEFLIVRKSWAAIIVIEIDELGREIIRRMLDAGVPIISMSDLRLLIDQVKDVVIDTTGRSAKKSEIIESSQFLPERKKKGERGQES